MTPAGYQKIKAHLVARGFADEIEWAQTVGPPTNAEDFALEAAFVICNSGMKATLARPIYERVRQALKEDKSARTAFGHPGKALAIDTIWRDRETLLGDFLQLDPVDRLEWLGKLPWIGPITKYHLGRNFGLNVVKPDRHLQRIADHYQTTPHALCRTLADATGDRIGAVDCVLWRAAEQGIIDTKALRRAA